MVSIVANGGILTMPLDSLVSSDKMKVTSFYIPKFIGMYQSTKRFLPSYYISNLIVNME